MYIKSIVLDGFKSYGNRVEVTGFDPEFNAITGLNGTGKSNILDSICFVLGITNLSNVRAGSLQELIYKHGQAGIIKATVSITFDNRDKRQCPVGYENHDEITVTRQVVMGGKNKYLINGINVQNKRVSDMFCSVQLNVNNPHFLIMQGRITKVLNMKPPEILSMVEEAAGTRMYEAKKQAAQKTIEKKDAKLRELNDIIKEDIAPKLQKLQDERYQFQEYQKVVRELENLTRLYTAWTYVGAQQAAREAAQRAAQAQRDIAAKRDEIAANGRSALRLQDQLAALNGRLERESGGGSALAELEAALGGAERAEAAGAAEERAAREAEAAHAARTRLLTRALHDDTAALAAKEEELQAVSAQFESLRSASEGSAAALAEAQARFLAVSTGLEGGSESLQDQLMAAKREESEAATRVEQSRMRREHAQRRLGALEREAGAGGAQQARDQREVAAQQAQLARLQTELARLAVPEGGCGEAQARTRHAAGEARARRGAAEALAARLQRCDFRYQPPTRDFDHGRVAGTVCRLLDVKDPKYCTALETAAGGRLYNVVVDTEVTSKLLLERGQLQTRTTIIPLNKISSRVIGRDTLRVAQEVGGGAERVQLALELVSFPERVRAAMAWVFGGVLVCADLDTARRVTFHPRVRCRCVTLDGDVVDPAGTLSGGARVKGGSVLLQLQELKQLEAEARAAEEELAARTAELGALQQLVDKHNTLKQQAEVAEHALQVLRARVAASAHAQLHEEIAALREQVSELEAALQQGQRGQREAAARAADLEAKVRDIKGHREREFKKAEEALQKAKVSAERDSESWKRREQEFSTLQLEVQELRQAARAGERQLGDAARAAEDLQRGLQRAQDLLRAAADNVKSLQAQIKQKKAEIASKNADAARLAREIETLGRLNGDLELAIKQLEFTAAELQAEVATCHKKIKSLEESNAWIESEREYFGLSGGLYDFEARGAAAAADRLQQLRKRRDCLARGLNARAHTLLGKEEEQYQDVMRKKKIVEADRAKLVQVMAELDEKKKLTLIAACEQVNRDFGSIFSSLLPGAQARLTPPPGRTVLDGLEVKVGFNRVWKESLGELSGGQRSLVALSLVLAMLLFKPAPLYILDEVDAALDLSHTQNIGQMLKEHFKHSQPPPAPRPAPPPPPPPPPPRTSPSDAVCVCAVHHSVAEGRHVQQRQRAVPHALRGRHVRRAALRQHAALTAHAPRHATPRHVPPRHVTPLPIVNK